MRAPGKSKGKKEQHLGLAEEGCGVLAGWDTGKFRVLMEEGMGQGSSTSLLVPKFSLNTAVLPGRPSAVSGSFHRLLKLK